jgi:hypothetical protein
MRDLTPEQRERRRAKNREAGTRYRAAHPDKNPARCAANYSARREERIAWQRAYRAARPEKRREGGRS